MFPYWVNYFRNILGTTLSYSIIRSKMMCVHQRPPVCYTETTDMLFGEVEESKVWTYVVHMMCRSIEHTWLCWYWIIYFVIHYLLEASWKHVVHGAIKDEYIHTVIPHHINSQWQSFHPWLHTILHDLAFFAYNSAQCPSTSCAATNIAKIHTVITSMIRPKDNDKAEVWGWYLH